MNGPDEGERGRARAAPRAGSGARAAPGAGSGARAAPGAGSWALPAAAAVLSLENAAILAGILFLGDAPPLVSLFLLVKFPFCIGLIQRRHGAFMLLTLWEATTLVIGLLNPALDLLPRLALLGASAAGLTLLGMSLAAFPETRLPSRGDDPHRPPDVSLN